VNLPALVKDEKFPDSGSEVITYTSLTGQDVLSEFCLKDYQLLGRDFLTEKNEAAVVLNMSAGKTVITLSAIVNRFALFDINAVLVVAPLRVCHLVWPEEISKWEHTRWMTVGSITGSAKQRREALYGKTDIYLINYENLLWLFDTLATFREFRSGWPFDAIVFDELTNMKGYTSKRFKRYKKLVDRFVFRWGLTGTIMPNSYQDLFAQYYSLDGGKRLGSSFYSYRVKYFYPTDYQQFNWVLHEGAEEKIQSLVQDITLEIDHDAGLPEVLPPAIVPAELSPKLYKQYKTFEKEMFMEIDGEEFEAFNKAALSMRCHQFVQGAMYYDEEKNWKTIHTAKFDALNDTLEEIGRKPTIIYYYYKHDLERLEEYLKKKVGKADWRRIAVLSRLKTKTELEGFLNAWNAGELWYVLSQPGSAGHGLNLQFGGSTIIWFSLPYYRLDLYLQANARLIRTHQKETVAIYHILVVNTIDYVMYNAMQDKEATQADFMTAIRNYRHLLDLVA